MDTINILIVDDNPKNIQLAANVLKSIPGYVIYFSTDGEGALEQLKKRPFDLILLDIMMPGIGGFETAVRIKNNPETAKTPIIFLTANASQESIVKAFELGAEDYITKPFNQPELISRAKTHIELYRIRQKMQEDIDTQQLLLEQYKSAVDISAIVQKMDDNGIITYVNRELCNVSGYTQKELIGKPFDFLVDTDDTASCNAGEMWTTIKANRVWSGKAKKEAKSGGYFIVDMTVMPIVRSDGLIEEYICIANDITEISDLKQEIFQTHKEILFTLGEISEIRSKETGEHVTRVSAFSAVLGEAYGLGKEELELLKMASPMHDVGKIAIPDAILLKPGKLTEEEMNVMQTHALVGYELFKNSPRKMLQTAAVIAHEHHERYDGKGYPRGLKGEAIHIYGRITAIADVFDALTHDRVYKEAWPVEEALTYIRECSGSMFDPKLVECFFDNIDKILAIKKRHNA